MNETNEARWLAHYKQLCRLELAAINLLNAMSSRDAIDIETARVDLENEVNACFGINIFDGDEPTDHDDLARTEESENAA